MIKEDAEQDAATRWTINRNAERGDLVLLYVCKPTAAIVAIAEVETKPEFCDDPGDPFHRSHYADMINLVMLSEPITRAMLREVFPTWRYWTQPRNSSRVPDQFAVKMIDWVKRLVR